MKRIMLSASNPGIEAAQFEEAVRDVLRGLLGSGAVVVYGMHPSVTPVVLQVLAELGISTPGRVVANTFSVFPVDPAVSGQAAITIKVTQAAASKLTDEELTAMRAAMVNEAVDGAVFLGGKIADHQGSKPGIAVEYEMFTAANPAAPVLVLAGLGGAAADLPPGVKDLAALLA